MCTETFLRLPEEKRSRFLEASWEEFTSTSFAEASINRIIRRAGIPRGSFYQYFTDKDDLFAYLLGQMQRQLTEEFQEMVVRCGGDIFQTQALCFDRVVLRGTATDPLLGKYIRILQMNSALQLHMMPMIRPDEQLLDAIWEHVDLTDFRCRDRAFVQHIFLLTLLTLAASIKDVLEDPENAAAARGALLARLEIIRHGCLNQERALCEQMA